jgi:hypothetical protein
LKNKGKMCDNNGDNDANDLPSTPPEVADIAEKVLSRAINFGRQIIL